ncbi:MAG TPA: copper-binding protein [Blastocatellia bacterium]|nr:copper-binding protein [Blastocatellia bacterium]
MKKMLIAFALSLYLSCQSVPQSDPKVETDRDRDGLVGPVKAVLTDDVVFAEQAGAWVETQQVSATAIYDASGKKTLQTPFRLSLPSGYAALPHETGYDPKASGSKVEESIPGPQGSASGKWVKTYNARGYLIEQVRFDAGGSVTEKQAFTYEYDSYGNWVRRTASKVVSRDGRATTEPLEASYRMIIYDRPDTPPASQRRERQLPARATELKTPLTATEENIANGRTLYNQRCASCHGENGKAQTEIARVMEVKPADLTGQPVREMSDGEVYRVITDGISVSRMPALGKRIGERERWQITLYVRSLRSGRPPTPEIRPEAANGVDTHQQAAPRQSPAPSSPARRYNLKGRVVSVDQQYRQVTIEHEAIEGYMEAMTMPFPLKDERLYQTLKVGDHIQATLVVAGDGRWWLEDVVPAKGR